MKWTKDQPTKPGWYWIRNAGQRKEYIGEERRVVCVRDYVGKLCIENWEIPDKDTEWAGPVPEPEEVGEEKK